MPRTYPPFSVTQKEGVKLSLEDVGLGPGGRPVEGPVLSTGSGHEMGHRPPHRRGEQEKE